MSGARALILAAALASSAAHADVFELGRDGSVTNLTRQNLTRRSLTRQPVPSIAPSSTTLHAPSPWIATVEATAARHGISPALLEAVIWQESRWHTGIASPAGAYGLTQLMPGTAQQMGVDRRDPVQNIDGGARYLRQQLDRFNGNIDLALAAYNAGPGRVARAGAVPNIRETQGYVAAIFARMAQYALTSGEQ